MPPPANSLVSSLAAAVGGRCAVENVALAELADVLFAAQSVLPRDADAVIVVSAACVEEGLRGVFKYSPVGHTLHYLHEGGVHAPLVTACHGAAEANAAAMICVASDPHGGAAQQRRAAVVAGGAAVAAKLQASALGLPAYVLTDFSDAAVAKLLLHSTALSPLALIAVHGQRRKQPHPVAVDGVPTPRHTAATFFSESGGCSPPKAG